MVKSYSVGHIDSLVDEDKIWRFIGFYGNSKSDRSHSWELLRRLKGHWDYPWLRGDNFNETLSKRKGGVTRLLANRKRSLPTAFNNVKQTMQPIENNVKYFTLFVENQVKFTVSLATILGQRFQRTSRHDYVALSR
ncbi:Endonuclease/exonuclease/phosphatase [Abeliophyllum distichum]|uniref:Endonuclease/exonuclease/phosphatase n=1 Tax=Abeliophyllum distichum TaxID=126358 RepID=A0ABD1Q4G3_9LAMI